MVARGTHPNSLANLRPPWVKGEQPANPNPDGDRGPIVTPRLRYYARLTLGDLLKLDPESLSVADALAVVMLVKGVKDGAWGDKAREMVMNRLDGGTGEITINDNRTYVREVHTTQQVRLG